VTLEMFAAPDPLLRQAIFRAYNDWIADYCAPYPGKLKALGVIDTADLDAAIAEMERVRAKGVVGVLISVNPGDGRYVRPEFDRFWAAAVSLGLPVSLHGGTDVNAVPFNQLTVGMMCTISTAVQTTLVDLVYGGVFARHPRLKVLSVENGAGWAPYMMQAMDARVYLDETRKLRFGKEEPMRPSDYIRRNVGITFMSDKLAIRQRDVIGVEALLWASDYPHHEGTFPHSLAVLDRQMVGVPDDVRDQIVRRNTAALYGFDLA
jgi:predicted TIM-barrel fold metal-dependent hydrolase